MTMLHAPCLFSPSVPAQMVRPKGAQAQRARGGAAEGRVTQWRRCHFKLFVLAFRLNRDSAGTREAPRPSPLLQPPVAGDEAVPPRTLAIRLAFRVRVSETHFPESRSRRGEGRT